MVGRGEVQTAVAVKVSDDNGGAIIDVRGIVSGRLEAAVAAAQQDIHASVNQDKIRNSVAIKVSHGYRVGGDARVCMGGLKGAIAVAQQDTDPAGARRAVHGEVWMAVAVKVCDGHGRVKVAHGIAFGCLEGAVAVAQQDIHAYADHDKIGNSVGVKVSYRYRVGVAGRVVM